ncbi:MAG: hypothetical protein AAB821_00620 [Patescibacteria group bacterium]
MFRTKLLLLANIILGLALAGVVWAESTDGVGVTLSVPPPPPDCTDCTTYGCKDPTAKNYSPNANVADNSLCKYYILGCTDPGAENYNSLAERDDLSCTYVPMATDFEATYEVVGKKGLLSWNNPTGFANLAGVRLVRKTGSIPTTITDGTVVYDGLGEEAQDASVQLDIRYYYALFVRSTTGHYSAPAVAVLTPGQDDDDPFEEFPTAISDDPLISALNLGDFIFTQVGERPQYFGRNGLVTIKGDKNFTVTLPYEKVPEVLKTIGITLHDPIDQSKTFSFTLRLNRAKTAYTATVAPLGRTGTYRVSIYVLNFADQTIKKITGNLMVATPGFLPSGTLRAAGQIGQKLAVGVGIGAILFQTLGLTSHLNSIADLYLILMRLLGWLLGLVGFKKKSKPWGTVYDAVTKRPIDPAYVTVESGPVGTQTSSAITDIDGRYGFLLPAGTYILKAGKTHYSFPSRTLYGKNRDELYNNLYFGEPVRVEGEEIINKNIPLDPIGFDWNEFAKSKSEFFKIYSLKEIRRNRVFSVFYLAGLIISVASLIITPSWLDIIVLLFYGLLFIFQKYWLARHKPVQIKSKTTGEPLPFAIVRFYLAGIDTEIKSVVADELGRFYVLLRPETYYYTIEEKEVSGTYHKVYTSEPVNLSRGVITADVIL